MENVVFANKFHVNDVEPMGQEIIRRGEKAN